MLSLLHYTYLFMSAVELLAGCGAVHEILRTRTPKNRLKFAI